MTKRLAIIDGKSVFYRGYYAMPNLSMRDGTPTGGVYGFAAMSLELMKKLKPDYVCVAWDKPKTNIRKRLEIYPEYKAGRKPAPSDFYAQVPLLNELLEAFSWPLYEADDYEADDILCTLAEQANEQGIEVCLITSDLDALQCVSPLTHVYALKKGFSNIERFDPASFEAKYGLRVDQFLDLKSLKGDSSDNIPGVPGIGEKTAVTLLQEYETLDNVYENLWQIKGSVAKKLEAGKDSAYMSKEIATLYHDAPFTLDLPAMDVKDLDTLALKTLLTRFEFRSLLRNLPAHMQNTTVVASSEPELADITAAEHKDWSEAQGVALAMSDKTVVQLIDDKLYISNETGIYSHVVVKNVAKQLASAHVITHDANTLCHYLLRHDVDITNMTLFDVKHAAFLLNPLRKSRELEDLAGIDATDPALAIAGIWAVHGQQSTELEALPRLHDVAYDIDFPLIPILARMEHRGILLDTEMLASMSKELSQQIHNIQQQMYKLVGEEFNISSPAQLSEVLYTKLQLSTIGIKKGKTGFSTGQSELDKLRGSHPIIEQIEQYRELTKLLSTYVDALPKLVDENSRLHTTFRQDVAATGRLSSIEPNLQNIPVRSEQGRKIREAFVPAKGNVFVSADYSQFELRLAAVLAGDKPMINDFNAGTDIHAKTAAEVYKIPLDDVTKDQRRDAKVINFGVLYGMSPHGLAAATGMSFHDAKVFIDEYFKLRAPIRKYIDVTIAQAKDLGYVETYFGRRRPTPDAMSSNFIVRQAAERQAANMPIQGTEADLMKMAMIKVEKKLEGIGEQLLQIHDSILVECPAENANKVAEILKQEMEQIYPAIGIKLDVDVHTGKTWGEV
jgi:DNA polymerase-1